MTTATQARQSLEEVIQPALDAYGKALDEHSHQFGGLCRCGWQPKDRSRGSARRSVGLHIAAAKRRASKAYDTESARLMDEARKAGWR